jgi:hypothetical protein
MVAVPFLLSLKATPFGSAPVSVIEGTEVPVVLTVKVKPEPAVAEVLVELMMARDSDRPVVIRPIESFPELVNHSAPSGPAVMASGPSMVGDV